MTLQIIIPFIIGGFGLGSVVIAFINLIRPKGDWQKSVEDERAEFQIKDHCKDAINIRVRFSISLLCRRILQLGNFAVYLLIGIALVVVIVAVCGLLAWFALKSGNPNGVLPAGSTPDSACLILTGVFGVILLIALIALAASFFLTTAIDVLESGRENP